MTLHLGDVPASSTLYIPFHTFNSSGASVTITGLAVTDVEIYKNGSVTQRSSDAGYTLLDTDGIDFDGITGIHGFSVDLSDNTDAGFYAVGSFYWVVVSSITVNTQTVNMVAATFRIVAAEGVAGKPKVDVDAFGGTAGTFSGGRPEVNTTHAAGTAWGSGAITAGSIAADAITAAKVAADVTTELQSGLATAAALATTDGKVDSILADTGTDGVVVAAGSKTGYSLTATTGLGNQTANITGNLSGSVGSVTGAVGSVTGAVGSVTGNVGGNVVGSVASVTAGVTLAASAVQAIWDALTTALTTVGSIGKKLADWTIGTAQTGDSFARLGAPAGASVSADIAAVKVDTAAILVDTGTTLDGKIDSILDDTGTSGVVVAAGSKTGYSIASGGIGSGAHAAAELNAIADAHLDRNMATGVDSGADNTTTRTVRQALRILRNKRSVAAGTLTVTKENDTTASWTAAVGTAAGDPTTSVDPT